MQKIFDAGVDASEYQRQGKDFAFPDLSGETCPQCEGGLLRKGHFGACYVAGEKKNNRQQGVWTDIRAYLWRPAQLFLKSMFSE